MIKPFTLFYGKYQHLRTILLTPRFPKINSSSASQIESLGSTYGRKFFDASKLQPEPLLVSGGVGEDISFDVEFISKYGGKVVLIDPTPRAITHISEVASSQGEPSQVAYSNDGKQHPNSYDLTKINSTNLVFYPFAMLDSAHKVKFYEPPISDHVSYSVQNIQQKFSSKGSFIEVDSIGPRELWDLIDHSVINILKLDIEGSEFQFLKSAFDVALFPEQILIEIDELHFPSFRSRRMAIRVFNLLSTNNYKLVFRDGYNFTYVRSN